MGNSKITLVVAMGLNRGIGKDNQLIHYHPRDMKFFKELTVSGVVVMGRKTYESIGQPLPNRKNIVLSRQKDLVIGGVEVVNSIEQIKDDEIFVIGGQEIYELFLDKRTDLYITLFYSVKPADAYFPIDPLSINCEEIERFESQDTQFVILKEIK